MTNSHVSQSGEAGHQGADRAAGDKVSTSHLAAPEPGQEASPAAVKSRSREAVESKKKTESPDHLHPGSDRADSEKSLGAIHDAAHQTPPNMYKEFKKL